MNREFSTPNAPAPLGHYSQGVKQAGSTQVSMQFPIDPATGKLVEGGIQEQTAQVLKNCEAVMKEAFLGLHVIVKTNVYLRNLADFEAFNEVYKTFFPEIKPAMTVIPVSDLLVKDALLMVDMVACK